MPQHPMVHRHIVTPWGEMLISGGPAGLRGAWFTGQSHHPTPATVAAWPRGDHPVLQAAEAALKAHGVGQTFTPLVLDWNQGTDFQRAVWRALLTIPSGQTRSYSELAQAVGKPAAVRAVGAAVGRNPWSVLVPCHRVLGAKGALTGYAGGLPRKVALLDLEQKR
jgi:methylated-DNA-[protein]-cysteine S-methyltransferase